MLHRLCDLADVNLGIEICREGFVVASGIGIEDVNKTHLVEILFHHFLPLHHF